MGYNTDFRGELKFSKELTASQLNEIKKFFGEDTRDHPEWGCSTDPFSGNYIDLELLDDFSGIKWNGAEKTYCMIESVNIIIDNMRKLVPDFSFIGELIAQGEEFDDRWKLVIKEGKAVKIDIIMEGQKVQCPHCEEYFILE